METLELIPWYAVGCLSKDEKIQVQKQLALYPHLQEQIDEEKQLIQHVKEDKSLLELSSLEPTQERLSRVLEHLENTTQHAVSPETEKVSDTAAHSTSQHNIFTWIKERFFSSSNQQLHYASFASIAVVAALMVAFIAPLINDRSKTAFHPATIQPSNSTQKTATTTLLLGINNTNTSNSWLVGFLRKNKAHLSKIKGKDGLYRIKFEKKLTSKQTTVLINELNTHKKLIWFAGEAY